MTILLYLALFTLGACLGSFLCCQARRLHLRATTKGKRKAKLNRRSICLHCRKQLKWYDNIPIVSWLVLRGKCRHCHKSIGIAELLSELGTAIALPLLFRTINLVTATTLDWIALILVAIFALLTIFLAIYDGLYGELPTLFLGSAITLAIIIRVVLICSTLLLSPFSSNLITDPILALCILGGIYLVLYIVSKGQWVGDGDWLLGVALALVLGSPWLALIALFLTNFLACLIMLPLLHKNHKIHLGPFFVSAFIIIYSFSSFFENFML